METRNIRVIATFPGYLNYPEYHTLANRTFFDALVDFYLQQGVMVLGTPQDFMYKRKYFFDSQYHLTHTGMIMHTEKLFDLFSKMYGKIGLIEISTGIFHD